MMPTTTTRTGRLGWIALLALTTCVLLAVLGPVGPAQAQTVFTVTKTADTADGACDADCSLREAVIAANSTVGTDEISLPAGTYILTIAGVENASARGDLDLAQSVKITGAGREATTVDGNNLDRVFEVSRNVTVSLSGMTVRGGNGADGGGVYNDGTTTLEGVRLSGNRAPNGGALRNEGTATLIDSELSGNSASQYGGAITQFSNSARLSLTGVTVENNSAPNNGGAINMNGDLRLDTVSIDGNTSTSGSGGGVLIFQGHATIEDSTFADNHAARGQGGGLYLNEATGATSTITNTTFAGNTAASGGALANVGGAARLINVTIANNGSTAGGAGGVYAFPTLSVTDSIVANNGLRNCSGPLTSLGHNIDTGASCGFLRTGDLANTEPRLGPLRSNGGPTETRALLAGSPALDGGGPNAPGTDQRGVSRPQDGDRDGEAAPDVGAFERRPPDAVHDAATVEEGGDPFALDVLANDDRGDGGPLTIAGGTRPPTGEGDASCSTTECTFTPDPDYNGETGFDYTVDDGEGGRDSATVKVVVGPVNDAPTISPIDEITVEEDTGTGPVPFAVGDVETDPADLVLDADSSDRDLIPDAAIALGGSGENRTISLTPARNAFGEAEVTVRASDGDRTDERTFLVRVTPVNDAPVAEDQRVVTDEDTARDLTLAASDVDGDPLSYRVMGQPRHGTLEGAPPDLTYAPAQDYEGEDSFTFTASDGTTDSNVATVSIVVTGANDAPTISNVDDTTIDEDTSTGPLPFAVGDVETVARDLVVSGTSSDQKLVPDAGIELEGEDEERTVEVRPAPDAFGEAEITLTVTDGEGETARETFLLTVRDVNDVPPDNVAPTTVATPSSEPNGAGWHGQDVTVSLRAADNEGGSGVREIHYEATGAQEIAATTEPGDSATLTITAEGETRISYAATDETDNAEEPKALTIRLDKTAPVVTVSAPADGAEYALGQAVAADYACSDGGSGLDDCAGPVPDGVRFDTGPVGSKAFHVEARDRAGNEASVTHTYRVVYDFSGFFRPVDNPPTFNVVRAGQSVPLLFSLGGNRGKGILASGYPRSEPVSCGPGGPSDRLELTVPDEVREGLYYVPPVDRYAYVWETQRRWNNTCRQYILKLEDGTERRALFRFSR